MKKSELKPGMKVSLYNGEIYLITSGDHMPCESGGFMPLSYYNEDLSKINYDSDYSIEKIFAYEQYKYQWVEYVPDYLMKLEIPATEMLSMTFNLQGRSVIVIDGNKTKVLFTTDKNPEETFTGTATCMEGDVYNKKKGIRIATYKALAKYVQNELDKMTK